MAAILKVCWDEFGPVVLVGLRDRFEAGDGRPCCLDVVKIVAGEEVGWNVESLSVNSFSGGDVVDFLWSYSEAEEYSG